MRPIRESIMCLMCVVGVAAPAHAGEHATKEDLPPAVRQTIERETKGATVRDIERDREDGKPIYEVEYLKDGERWELDVSSTGEVLERHRD
jgi:uncharacterized protein YpmB